MTLTLYVEPLEPRLCCCDPCDVTGDGHVTPQDALVIINAVNVGEYAEELDVNSDGWLTPMDPLLVVNWLNSQIRPEATHKIRYAIRDTDIYGFTDAEVRDIIFATFDEFESRWDLEFVEVQSPPYQFIFTTAELYSGSGTAHWGGLFNYDTNELFIHNCWVSPYHHDGTKIPLNQGFWWPRWVGRPQVIQQIIGHEILHSFGFDHSNIPNCRSNFNAPPGFCQQEINWFNSRFGAEKAA